MNKAVEYQGELYKGEPKDEGSAVGAVAPAVAENGAAPGGHIEEGGVVHNEEGGLGGGELGGGVDFIPPPVVPPNEHVFPFGNPLVDDGDDDEDDGDEDDGDDDEDDGDDDIDVVDIDGVDIDGDRQLLAPPVALLSHQEAGTGTGAGAGAGAGGEEGRARIKGRRRRGGKEKGTRAGRRNGGSGKGEHGSVVGDMGMVADAAAGSGVDADDDRQRGPPSLKGLPSLSTSLAFTPLSPPSPAYLARRSSSLSSLLPLAHLSLPLARSDTTNTNTTNHNDNNSNTTTAPAPALVILPANPCTLDQWATGARRASLLSIAAHTQGLGLGLGVGVTSSTPLTNNNSEPPLSAENGPKSTPLFSEHSLSLCLRPTAKSSLTLGSILRLLLVPPQTHPTLT